MNDPRVDRLAELVVNYSLDVQEGQVVRIDGFEVAAPLAVAVHTKIGGRKARLRSHAGTAVPASRIPVYEPR